MYLGPVNPDFDRLSGVMTKEKTMVRKSAPTTSSSPKRAHSWRAERDQGGTPSACLVPSFSNISSSRLRLVDEEDVATGSHDI